VLLSFAQSIRDELDLPSADTVKLLVEYPRTPENNSQLIMCHLENKINTIIYIVSKLISGDMKEFENKFPPFSYTHSNEKLT
jgi:hypothetical protein